MKSTFVHFRTLAVGLALGYALSRMGFTDFTEVHRMFTFADLRLFLTFMGAVVLTGAALYGLTRGAPLQRKPIHKGTVIGGILFGAGWALTGACPGAAFAMLGEGQLLALVSLSAIAIGTMLYRIVHARYFRWDRGSCEE